MSPNLLSIVSKLNVVSSLLAVGPVSTVVVSRMFVLRMGGGSVVETDDRFVFLRCFAAANLSVSPETNAAIDWRGGRGRRRCRQISAVCCVFGHRPILRTLRNAFFEMAAQCRCCCQCLCIRHLKGAQWILWRFFLFNLSAGRIIHFGHNNEPIYHEPMYLNVHQLCCTSNVTVH